MLIIGDRGDVVVNSDQVFSYVLGQTQDGTAILQAVIAGVQVILAAVGDRPTRATETIVKAHKENWKVCDLNDILGARPNLAVAKTIVDTNGKKLIG